MTDDQGLTDGAGSLDPSPRAGDDGGTENVATDSVTHSGQADSAPEAGDLVGTAFDVPALGSVLVTGGGGFIGSHLVDALATRNEVRVLDTFETGSPERLPADVRAIEGDVRDRTRLAEAVADVDVVVHLAAQVSVEDSLSDPPLSHETNVTATIDVLELARREDARVVLASSAAIYGNPASVPIYETDPKRPESPYGVDKLAADSYARVYGARFDVPVVVLRYFNVYGPGANAGVIEAFAERATSGEPLVIHGDGEQTRDFVHVEDVVRATLAATETDDTGRAYNVGTGDRTSIEALADLVADRAPASVAVEHAPPRSGDVDHSLAAIDRARSALDYEPAVGIRGGIDSVLPAAQPDR
jgi:UDP-glucose 4-epimerase